MTLFDFSEMTTKSLIRKYPYIMGYFHGADVAWGSSADADMFAEAFEAFEEAGMTQEYFDFLGECGFITAELISEVMQTEQGSCVTELIRKYQGTFSGSQIIEMLDYGIDERAVESATIKCNHNVSFDEIAEACSYGMSETGIRNMIQKSEATASKEQIEEILSYEGEEYYPYLAKFINKLSPEDRAEIREIWE